MVKAQEWLDREYPKEERSKVGGICLNEPSLEGELDLGDFISVAIVYVSAQVDETKLIFKNSPEKVKIIKGYVNNYNDLNILTNEEKVKTKVIYIDKQDLEGELDLSNFINLKELKCSDNKLTSLNLSTCSQLEKISCLNNLLTNLTLPTNPNNCKELDLGSNNFPIQDLSFLTPYTNLEKLELGNYDEEKISQNIYNRFTGSLDYLSNMKKLKELDISNTDLNEVNIKQLPSSFEEVNYSTELRPDCQLTIIVPTLEREISRFNLCLKCQQPNTSRSWCQNCAEQEWKTLTGQELIDKFIEQQPITEHRSKLQWIPYEKFTNIEYLAEGGFSKIHKAYWGKDWKGNDRIIVLKILTNSQQITPEFLIEITNARLAKIGVVEFHGISQDPQGNYIMVMEYVTEGNLRDYLKNNIQQLTWGDKLDKLWSIVYGLNDIHFQNLVHRDFHSGNILNDKIRSNDDGENYLNSFITDLGLSQLVNSQAKENEIFGVMPYVAPEVLRGQPYTQESDIYSMGIIMNEVITGLPPFYNEEHDVHLALKICQGLRPQFQIKIPQMLEDLINGCWNVDPQKRPSAGKIEEILGLWSGDKGYSLTNERVADNEKFTQQLKIVEAYNQTLPNTIKFPKYEIHKKAFYTSKPINTKQISELLESSKQNNISQSIKFPMTELHEELEKTKIDNDTQFSQPVEFSTSELNQINWNEIESANWIAIHPSFTSELIQEWQSFGFTYQQTQEWINIGLQPTDYNFCAWLRDNKNYTPEQVLNHGNLEQLNQEYFQWWQQQQLQTHQEIPPK